MNKELIIEGPCKLKVVDGQIKIIGIDLQKGESITIYDKKTYTIVYNENTKMEMDCKIINSNLSLNWDEKAQEIFSTGGTAILLGDTDSGKTYFTTLLSNISFPHVMILDADVGQSTLFLPAFIAALKPRDRSLSLEDKGFDRIDFFGDITPSVNPRLHVNKILRLYETVPQESLTIIDTDGWINGFKAMLHKFELIYLIDPDYIVIFDNKIKDLLPPNYRNKAVLLKRIDLHKDRYARKIHRISKYRKYFNEAKEVKISAENLIGSKISDILYFAWGDYVQLISEEPCIGYYIDLDTLKGALLGIIKDGEIIGAGLLKDLRDNYINVLSKTSDFTGVMLGYISLNDKFEERRIRFRKCKS
ncbi:MAG: Clp1/GlmU family protein [Saccharolobus sp.]|jgi:polynucleotide 5'-kinase involved in rRNA processing|uniref:Clp1/GlmU family protein n=1 Tax=Saccharolobus sp. TaxID=2100761 RepID=UPI0028CED970|nr:Clp1/GlmU family protein [Saccharolobus sp.]MDT7862126.1 Clp1/GlmU family protein [Saccharolobus sp.]